MKEQMNSRERVMTALAHQETDRIPFSLGFGVNPPARKALRSYLGLKSMQDVDTYLNKYVDLRWVHPRYVGPSSRNTVQKDGLMIDVWGVGRKAVSYGAGEYDEIAYYPLKEAQDIKDLDDYQWPSPLWWDSSDLRDRIGSLNRFNPHAIVLGNGNIFESSWYMRGFEQMFMDLMVQPELAWEIMTRVTDYFIAYFKRMLEAVEGMIDIVFTADDLGGQEGLLMSPKLWEKMIKPHHIRLNKVLHEYGVKIMYHTDGAVMRVIPGLVDMGIDILEALQFDAKGMDAAALKSLYGEKLCFHGGVSVQSTLPFGSVADVKNEVRERIKVLGREGGYILAPSHAIQAGTPPENITAFLEAADATDIGRSNTSLSAGTSME